MRLLAEREQAKTRFTNRHGRFAERQRVLAIDFLSATTKLGGRSGSVLSRTAGRRAQWSGQLL